MEWNVLNLDSISQLLKAANSAFALQNGCDHFNIIDLLAVASCFSAHNVDLYQKYTTKVRCYKEKNSVLPKILEELSFNIFF